MDDVIFAGFGMEIIKRADRFFIRYDAGELAVIMKEVEITEDEANKAMVSERDAYEVILSCQKKSKSK